MHIYCICIAYQNIYTYADVLKTKCNFILHEYNRVINIKYSHCSLVSVQIYDLSNGLKPVAAAQ